MPSPLPLLFSPSCSANSARFNVTRWKVCAFLGPSCAFEQKALNYGGGELFSLFLKKRTSHDFFCALIAAATGVFRPKVFEARAEVWKLPKWRKLWESFTILTAAETINVKPSRRQMRPHQTHFMSETPELGLLGEENKVAEGKFHVDWKRQRNDCMFQDMTEEDRLFFTRSVWLRFAAKSSIQKDLLPCERSLQDLLALMTGKFVEVYVAFPLFEIHRWNLWRYQCGQYIALGGSTILIFPFFTCGCALHVESSYF